MQRLAFGVEYDGSQFAGWQQQAGQRAVQSELKRAIGTVADHSVDLICGGRTDAGVHARAQVVHVETSAERPLRAWLLGVNANLPADLSVHWVWPVPAHFHARFSAQARSYEYVILNRPTRSALAARRATCIHAPLDVALMQQAALHLLGEHDFSAYRAAGCQSRSPVRRIDCLAVSREADLVRIEVTANAFLHHMVRNIVGLLVEVGRCAAPPEHALEVLRSRDRRLNAATAPAEGLYLTGVHYPAAFGLPASPGVEGGARSAIIAARW
jgi:tRNA pseudouridine38-40 synthase